MNAKAKSMSRGRLVLAMMALFLSSMCTMGDSVVTPIVDTLYQVFANENRALVDFAITGPSLVGVPFGLIAGLLCDRFDKKWVMVAGFAIFTVSANLGASTDVYVFTVCRCFACGVAWGLTNTTALAIIASMFKSDTEHAKVVGWYDAAIAAVGAVIPIAAGMLAGISWQDAFKVYWISIPVLIMLIVFLPSLPAEAKSEEKHDEPVEEVKAGWWKPLVPLFVQVLLVGCNYFVSLYMISVYVVGGGIGDEALVGLAASAGGIAAFVSALLFGAVYGKLKNAVYLPALFVIGLAYILMAFVPCQPIAIAGMAVIGFFWPFFFCYYYTRCTEIVPASKAGIATGFMAFAEAVACTLCSYYLMGLMDGFGWTIFQAWGFFGACMIVLGVISAVAVFMTRKKTVAEN